MTRILLIGGGGHCASAIDAMHSTGRDDIGGVVDNALQIGDEVLGVRVIGSDRDLPSLRAAGWTEFIVTIGSLGDTSGREHVHELALAAGLRPATVVHARAYVARDATVAEGVFIGALAYVGPRAVIGVAAIVNSGAIVEHDCVVGPLAHIAPGATLSGGVHIGPRTHVGVGASVVQGVAVGEETMIGAGSVVLRDVGSHVTAYGNPCRVVAT